PASAPTSRAPEIAARAVSFTRFATPVEIASPVSIASRSVRAIGPTVGRGCSRPIRRPLARFGPCLGAVMSLPPPRFGSIYLCLRLLQPVRHPHLAVHRRRGGEMLLRVLTLARAPGELAEAEVAVGDEGAQAGSDARYE